ncbi:class IV adenylate cyclase [Lactobacillus isalae]|uniref:class IV adenylate cyclase n=1 Tax=Lactobacillus isalae TaxID=2993455 RepID=UPI0024A9F0D7|nr:class IV adenylate cyclase [Lactobacillus isalae]
MFEVEKKYRIKNLTSFIENCKKNKIVFLEKYIEIDKIFVNSEIKDFNFKKGTAVTRIRKVEGKDNFITLKRKLSDVNSLELETKIEDIAVMEKILYELGLHELVTVHKTRQKSQLENINICLDNVDKIGWFVELEILINNKKNVLEAQQKIDNLAAQLELYKDNIETRKYDVLVFEKNDR